MQFMQPMPLKKAARIAGVIYLLLVITAPLRLMIIPNTLFVRGDAAATAANIAANETLFRWGIVGDLLAGTIVIFVTLALYRLFKEVDQSLAVLVVILGSLMVTPINFLNTVNDAAALQLARGADFLSVFDKPQREALALMFLRLHNQAMYAGQIFWGLWLFPLGVLTYRSRFLPRFLGVWLIINGFAYLIMSFTGLLLPQYYNRVSNYALPAMLGELAFMLWLVIMGASADGGTAGASNTRFAADSAISP